MALQSELIAALKRLLKAHGLTYATLGSRLGISEATVKRMFSRQAITLQRLDQICQLLDIGLAELAEESGRHRGALAELSPEQEQALVDDPTLLLALYLVLNRWQQKEVLQRYRWSAAQWTLLLARLDRLGVVELLPGNRARTRTARNFRWRREGPMQRFFQRHLLPDYFQRPFADEHDRLLLLTGMVSAASARQLQQRMEELTAEFDRLMGQDAGLPAAQRVGLSLVLAQRSWTQSLFASLRRD